MNRQLFTLVLLTILLAGCSKDEPVIQLDYTKENWTSVTFTRDDYVEGKEIESTLRACSDGESTELLEESYEVIGSNQVSRKPLSTWADQYYYKTVSYVKGKEMYAICTDSQDSSTKIERIDRLPTFFEDKSGVTIHKNPTISTTIENRSEIINVLKQESLADEKDLIIHEETLVKITPSLYNSLYLVLDNTTAPYPLIDFSPHPALNNYMMAVAYNESEKAPYIVFFNEDNFYHIVDINNLFELGNEYDYIKYTDLNIKTHNLDTVIKKDEVYPLYELTSTSKGESKTRLALQYSETQPYYTGEDDTNSEQMKIYLHTKPFKSVNPLAYPDVLAPKDMAYHPLIDAIAAAKPTKKVGDKAVYHLLTFVDGTKDQQFEVSKKSRSKKTDIYITDTKTNKSYKLTSEGAETFISFFPEFTN